DNDHGGQCRVIDAGCRRAPRISGYGLHRRSPDDGMARAGVSIGVAVLTGIRGRVTGIKKEGEQDMIFNDCARIAISMLFSVPCYLLPVTPIASRTSPTFRACAPTSSLVTAWWSVWMAVEIRPRRRLSPYKASRRC